MKKNTKHVFGPGDHAYDILTNAVETLFIELSLRYKSWRETQDCLKIDLFQDPVDHYYFVILSGPSGTDHAKIAAARKIEAPMFFNEKSLYSTLTLLIMEYLAEVSMIHDET